MNCDPQHYAIAGIPGDKCGQRSVASALEPDTFLAQAVENLYFQWKAKAKKMHWNQKVNEQVVTLNFQSLSVTLCTLRFNI
jgi:hypothetical protein